MAEMTNPYRALQSYQGAYRDGRIAARGLWHEPPWLSRAHGSVETSFVLDELVSACLNEAYTNGGWL